ncbi:MAG: hypothetical protein K8R23_06200 [Chthoniobacter sp.]|nr:hypothetical protein [Chthoniobacter sp.]
MDAHPPTIPLVPPAKRRPLIIRLLFGLAIFCFGVSILTPIFYLVEKVRGRAAWRAYEVEAKARGVKLEFTDYIPPKIPDAENFASIPIFDAVFRAAEARQNVPDPFKLPPANNGTMPNVTDPVKQVPTDLAAWQKYFVEAKILPAAGENAAADVLKALETFDASLAELHDAGTRLHCRFPVHWENGYSAGLPHFQPLQNASNIYALRLSAHLACGQSSAAYEDFRDGLRLSTAILEEPSAIAGLVRIAIARTMENVLWSGLANHQWAEAELRKIEADLSTLDWLKDYLFAISCERGGANAMIDLVIDNRLDIRGMSGTDETTKNHTRLYPTGWLYQSKLRLNHFLDELSSRIDLNQRRYFGDRSAPSSPENVKSTPEKYRFILFVIMASVFESIEQRYVQAASMTDHARIACALGRFRLARGAYPDALAGLVPEFLPSIPVEVVNGEPYRYRRTDDGSFILYSVGTDLRDDGGVIDPQKKSSKQADWVWRYPAK